VKLTLHIIFFLFLIQGFSQNKIDSLNNALSKSKTDTSKINIINLLALEFKNINPDTSIIISQKSIILSQTINYELGLAEANLCIGQANLMLGKNEDALLALTKSKMLFEKLLISNKKSTYRIKKNLANTLNTIGNVHISSAEYDLALKYQIESLRIRQIIHDKSGVASSFNNIALIYSKLGQYSESLKNHFASLKIKEVLQNKKGMAISYNNIGLIYKEQKNNSQALEYLKKSLSLSKEIGLSNLLATSYLNIGVIYISEKNFDDALNNLNESYKISIKEDNKEDISNAIGNIGSAFYEQKKYDEALKNVNEAIKLKTEIGDNLGVSSFLNLIGQIYEKKGDIKNAIIYGEKSLNLAKELKAVEQIKESSGSLYTSYQKQGNYKKAFETQNLFFATRDSILSENNQRELVKQELQYNFEKQSLADSLNYANQKKLAALENEAKFKSEKNKRYTLYVGLIIVVVFSIFIFNRFRITKKQKNIIEEQSHKLEFTHHQLEEKTKEIKDSILYSKEIQNTFLKSPTNSENYFKDTVLLYKPKDIVSGDFYWYKEIGNELFVVVGDCTGHGVPGAIISVLAIQSLEKTILNIKNHDELHILNNYMKNEFNSYYNVGGHVSIGLDYSIICINKELKKIYLSGSGASILVKNKSNELNNHKFDSINIGGNAPSIYEPSTVSYEFKDIQSIFMYTDGIIDQKGEVTGKKFGTKNLKELIQNLNTTDSRTAINIIETKINNWIGTADQIDDITLLGIQIIET
jgi:serine phosphatase RsbU (regulator of sigma subunit)/tetratricopeptide (TPR) repeat protein